MQNVSAEWLALSEQTIRPESYLEITIGITDITAAADATVTTNGKQNYSVLTNILKDTIQTHQRYTTLEKNMWALNSSYSLLPESNYGDTGYIGTVLSDGNGAFTTHPAFTMTFSQTHTQPLMGIEIQWGEIYGEYASSFTVTAYNGTTAIRTVSVMNNAETLSRVLLDVSDYNKIVIEVLTWCLPYRYARIEELYIGIKQRYLKSDILEYTCDSEQSPISEELPVYETTFEVKNLNGAYDPFLETGISKYLAERQKVTEIYGFKIDGVCEKIRGGTHYLSEWNASLGSIKASFTARSLIDFMKNEYIKGIYSPSGTTLYALATDVFSEAGLPIADDGSERWFVDTALQSMTTVAPLPICTMAECIQLIAAAAGAVIEYSRDGKIKIKKDNVTEPSTDISLYNSYSKPTAELDKPLKAIETSVYSYYIGNSGVKLFNGTMAINGTIDVTIKYSVPATSAAATISSGTLVSANYYANACVLKITANCDVTIEITGTELISSDVVISYANSEGVSNGNTVTIRNPLIADKALADVSSNIALAYYGERKTLQYEYRADPAIDVGDIILAEYKPSATQAIKATELKLSYSGAFRGKMKGRAINA